MSIQPQPHPHMGVAHSYLKILDPALDSASVYGTKWLQGLLEEGMQHPMYSWQSV